jgi:tetratricopeptide (TPR) repeat protein
VFTRHIREEPALPSAVRPELAIDDKLEQAIMRALAKHPADRYATATEFRNAVEAAVEKRNVQTEEQILCNACGVYAAARFKFCPECGHPRQRPPHDLLDTIPGVPPLGEEMGALDRLVRAAVNDRGDDDLTGSIFPLPMVGRETAIDAMMDFIDGAEHSFLSLFGPSGMGRTRILSEVEARLAGRDEVVVYRSACDPTGLKTPFHPIRNLVAAVLALPAVCPYDRLSKGLELLGLSRRDLPGVAELFGHHGELWQLEPEIRRRELFVSTIRVLKAATASRGKAVFLLDDVDLYDQPSRELLDSLSQIREDTPLRVVAAHGQALVHHWPAHVERLGLPALDEDDFAGLAVHLEQVAHENMPSARAMALRTGGNPNHLQHLVRFIVEGGQLEHTPQSLPDLIAERLGALPHVARVLCQTAAVFGTEIHRDLLRHALGQRLEGPALKTALSLTKARGLLGESSDGSVVRFCHPLIRDVVYDATPADVRRELHASAARALEPTTTDSLILGHHQEMAGNLLLASTLLARAGDDAVHQLDDTGAIALYQRALAAARQLMLADDDSASRIRFVTLSVKLADALRVSGQVSLARGLVEDAKWHSRGTPRLEAQLLQASAHLYACEQKHDLAVDCLHRGIGLAIHAGDMELLAELYLDLSSMYMGKGDPEKAITELREGLDLVTMGEGAEAQEGPKILWRLLLRMAQLHSSGDRMAPAVQLAERALVHARRIRSRIGSARVQTLLASFYEQMGDLRLADKYRQAAVGEMRRLGDRRGTAELLLSGVIPTRTLLRINPANLREARELADEVGWVEGVAQASRKTSQIKDF